MIRCDIHKGKLRLGNFIEPGRDAQPRKDEGFVIDLGNIGEFSFSFGHDILKPCVHVRTTPRKFINLMTRN